MDKVEIKRKKILQRDGESVRERAEKQAKSAKPAKRRVRASAKKVIKPLRFLRFFKYIIPPYFRNSWRELKQVTWPDRKQTWQLTSTVFIFAIIFSLVIGITDFGLEKIFRRILIK